MGPLRSRRGLGALELALALAMLAALLAWLPRPPRPGPTGAEADALAREMERLLAEISGAARVLAPVTDPANPVSLPSEELVLERPDGSRAVLAAASFQVRRRAEAVHVVRVRLVGRDAALFSAAQVGEWLGGSSP